MDLSRPYNVVSPSADPDVLMVLAHASRPLSGREVARRANRAQDTVRHVLERLVALGVVTSDKGGSALLFQLNRDHLAADAIQQLAELRMLFVERLRDALAAWAPQPVSAVLFGSAARGDGDATSDVDVLVVRSRSLDASDDAWSDQVEALSRDVRSWTGNHAAVVDIDEDQLTQLRDEHAPILESIRRDGVHLAGRPLEAPEVRA